MRLDSAAPLPFPFPRVMSALPDFVLAGAFALAWAAPRLVDTGMLRALHMTMLVEFLVVHASGFLGATTLPETRLAGTRLGRGVLMLALLGFYSLFSVAFSLSFKSWFPLVWFWSLMFNRMLPLLLTPPEQVRSSAVMGLWAASVVCYLFGAFATVIAPLPRIGMDQAAVASLQLSGGGLWIDEPWRVMAFGVVYFTLIGVVQLVAYGRLFRGPDARPERSPA